MSLVNSRRALRKICRPRTIVLIVLLSFGVGCLKPTPTVDRSKPKSDDPRSPRIKKRDQLHPKGTTTKKTPQPVRKNR